MKQYAIFHKPNMTPISFFCTQEAAMERLLFITDSNIFGVFEVEVEILKQLKDQFDYADYNLGTVCTINDCLLSIHPWRKTAYQHTEAIKAGLIEVCDVDYTYGKEIKRPKKEKEDDLNDFS